MTTYIYFTDIVALTLPGLENASVEASYDRGIIDLNNGLVIKQSETMTQLNTLRPRQNRRHFPDDIFKRNFFYEKLWISIKISLKFVPNGLINNIPALVQIMAWRRTGDKPLSEPMMASLLEHICVTRPQWVRTCATSWRLKIFTMMYMYHRNFVQILMIILRQSFNVIISGVGAILVRISVN